MRFDSFLVFFEHHGPANWRQSVNGEKHATSQTQKCLWLTIIVFSLFDITWSGSKPDSNFLRLSRKKLSSRDKTFFTSKAITKFLALLGKDKTKAILDYCLTSIWKLLRSWSFCMISAIRNTSWICNKENWLVMSTDLSVSYSRYSSHDMSVLGGGLRELLLVVWEKTGNRYINISVQRL